MSLNSIKFPGILIADFYKNSLVEARASNEQKEAGNAISNPISINERSGHLGKNGRNILVCVHYPSEQYLPGEQLDFLTSVLKACNLYLDDIAIVNLARQHEAFDDIMRSLKPKSILYFGIDPATIPNVAIPAAFAITKMEEIAMVSAPELGKLNQPTNESKALKRKLWDNLKDLFNV